MKIVNPGAAGNAIPGRSNGGPIGTLISFGNFKRNAAVTDDGMLLPNQITPVDTTANPVTLNLSNFKNGDRVVIVDKEHNFDINPVTLQSAQGTFNQTGTSTQVLDLVGNSDEWWLRFENGVFYTENAPAVAMNDLVVEVTITTTPGTPIPITHNFGTTQFLSVTYNLGLLQLQPISIQPDTVDLNLAWVDSNSPGTYRISLMKVAA